MAASVSVLNLDCLIMKGKPPFMMDVRRKILIASVTVIPKLEKSSSASYFTSGSISVIPF